MLTSTNLELSGTDAYGPGGGKSFTDEGAAYDAMRSKATNMA